MKAHIKGKVGGYPVSLDVELDLSKEEKIFFLVLSGRSTTMADIIVKELTK